MSIFKENEICLLLADTSIEEVEIVTGLHKREVDFGDGPISAFVYKIKICLAPDILLYVRPCVLSKLPDKNICVSWNDCAWKPEKK